MDNPVSDTIQPSGDIPAAQSVEKPSPAPPSTPAPVANPLGFTGTIMHYANQYGLLAGSILAAALIGTIVIKKIRKRKA